MLVAAGLFACYAATRFIGLTKLPIFVDEGIHIGWAVRVWQGFPFTPLEDGKLLQVWLASLVVPWASNTLWAARAVTVLIGGLALYACFQIGARLYSREAGFLCAALYVVCPFTLFYDRMALADGFLSTFAALTLLWSIALVQDKKIHYAVLLGVAMAAAILSKMPGLLALFTPLCTVILLGKPPRVRVAKQLALSYGITLALTLFPIVRFLQTTHQGEEKSLMGEGAAKLVSQFVANTQEGFQWLWFYWTPPILILGVAGFVFAIAKRRREYLLPGIVSLIPLLAFTAGSRIWFPRYLLLATVPVLSLVAGIVTSAAHWKRLSRLSEFKAGRHALSIFLVLLVGLFAWRVDWLLLTNPVRAPLPVVDRVQYIEAWPSGYGVAEAADYLRQEAKLEGSIVVVHHELGDSTNFGLGAYLTSDKRIFFRQFSIRGSRGISTLVAWARIKPIFVVLASPPLSNVPAEQPDVAELIKVADLVKSYPKPDGKTTIDVYRLKRPT
jgi:4-amino-4-deoxy-L-arabinose transferase-like glycosyltransferase